MDIVRVIMEIVSLALGFYAILIFLRILLTWFQSPESERVGAFLGRFTDPYIDWFRKFEFLKVGGVDLSLIASLVVLWIARGIAFRIAVVGSITIGVILAIILIAVTEAIFWVLGLFLVLAIIRILGGLFGANTALRFWIVLDQLLEPIVHRVVSPIARDRFVSYQNALLMFAGIDLVVLIGGNLLVDLVASFLARLPF